MVRTGGGIGGRADCGRFGGGGLCDLGSGEGWGGWGGRGAGSEARAALSWDGHMVSNKNGPCE